ncbi:pyridoxamine 5'-phosphate oxidase [Paenibacillus psychroresistens]|uniref:Pyridoxamine 5'-phosphate oxidase n=2 Tax=Paenibacillus psychroresistens TaxID=1778678 RepID=A0A6B8RWH2_9BACL|nr:pyridoxamine 5'-phosphate oxidase [Paenibacillus psychroresistens]
MQQIMALVEDTVAIVVNSIDDQGYPNSKAMFKMEHDGLQTFLFSTNTSSMRVQQFLANPKSSLYFKGQNRGLMVVGKMEVCLDQLNRERLWFEGAEKYYPLGVNDPDYCVLKFTSETGNYYFNLQKHVFEL